MCIRDSSKGASGVDFRAKNYDSIENLEKNSLDFYASVKSLYLQDRQQKILNSRKIISTQLFALNACNYN